MMVNLDFVAGTVDDSLLKTQLDSPSRWFLINGIKPWARIQGKRAVLNVWITPYGSVLNDWYGKL